MTKKLAISTGIGVAITTGLCVGLYFDAEHNSRPMSVSKGSIAYEIKRLLKNSSVQLKLLPNSIIVIENDKKIDELYQGLPDNGRLKEGLRRGWKYKVKYFNSNSFQTLVEDGPHVTCIDQNGDSCD